MRQALGYCTFPPGSAAKRIAREVNQMPIENISGPLWDVIVLLAYRFRRQMPPDLVPVSLERDLAQQRLNSSREEKARALDARRAARATARQLRLTGFPTEASLLEMISGERA